TRLESTATNRSSRLGSAPDATEGNQEERKPLRRNQIINATTDSSRPPTPNTANAQNEVMFRTSQPKFWPKNPVITDSGRKIVATIVSCFITALSRLDTVER